MEESGKATEMHIMEDHSINAESAANSSNSSNDEKEELPLNNQHDADFSRLNSGKSLCDKAYSCLCPCLRDVDLTSKRYVFFRNRNYNRTDFSNKVENHKYNLITFIPVVLFNQFRQFGNFFYLPLVDSKKGKPKMILGQILIDFIKKNQI